MELQRNLEKKYANLLPKEFSLTPKNTANIASRLVCEEDGPPIDTVKNFYFPKRHKRKCHYCPKVFSSTSNCRRHEKTIHDGKIAGKQKASQIGGAWSDKIFDEDDDEKAGVETKPEAEWKFWGELVKESIDGMTKLPTNTKALLSENPYLTEFFDNMRQKLEDIIKLSDYMRDKDPIYEQIKDTAGQFVEERGLEQDEAFEKAWEERKYLLKRYLRAHSDEIDKQLEKDSISDTDENKPVELEDDEAGVEEMNEGNDSGEVDKEEESSNVDDEDERSSNVDDEEESSIGDVSNADELMLGPQRLFALKAQKLLSGPSINIPKVAEWTNY